MNTAATKVRSVFAVTLSLAIVFGLAIPAQTQDAARAEYPDVPRGHWANEAINTVSQSGAIEGMPDGNYNGDKAMTRSAFATSFARLFTRMPQHIARQTEESDIPVIRTSISGIGISGRVGFSDVPRGHWAYEALNTMIQCGIIEGLPNGTFGANKPLTRYDCAVAFARLLRRVGHDLEVSKSMLGIAPHRDVPQTHWAFEAVRGMYSIGIFEGYADGKFHGEKQMSRYEFAVSLARLFSSQPPPRMEK